MSDQEADLFRPPVGLVAFGRDTAGPRPVSTLNLRSADARIGFVGLGRMGGAMAANLVQSRRRVMAYVRRPERVAELAALGLEASVDISTLRDCAVVITSLPDDDAVREIVFGSDGGHKGLLDCLGPGAIHLSTSTISPKAASAFAVEHVLCGQGYVAAPLFGNPDAAKARELFILAAGAADDVERCRPIFDMLGQRTIVVGSDPADANFIKLAGNVLTASTLETLAEVLALARKRGLDPNEVMTVLTGTLFDGRVHKIHGGRIAAERYSPGGFVFPLALKDMRLALAEAEAAGVPMPSVEVVRDRLIKGIAHGYASLDWSALGLLAARESGLKSEPALPAATPRS
jgi:3-hydroxyisobutyrate dehydrogenase-like beta-hydroxyacid dehydrogenase